MKSRYSSFMDRIFNRAKRDETAVSLMSEETQAKIAARKEKFEKQIADRKAKIAAKKAAAAAGDSTTSKDASAAAASPEQDTGPIGPKKGPYRIKQPQKLQKN